jgi:hypothetical protein
VRQQERRAKDPTTPAEELRALAALDDSIIRSCLAVNPNTPADILERLSLQGETRQRLGEAQKR